MEKKEKSYKCWYKYCKLEKVKDSEAIKIGNKRYHKNCYYDHEDIRKARELYVEHIQQDVVMTTLNSAINNIIVQKKVLPEFLLFTIEYIIRNKLPVNYPYGLYYKVADYRIKKAFEEQTIINNTNLEIFS